MDYQESFISYLRFERRCASHTVVAYKQDLQQFVQFCIRERGLFDAGAVDRKLVRAWVVHLVGSHLCPRTVQRKVSALKAFYRYLMKMEILDSSPLYNLPLPKVRKRLPRFVEEKSLHHLLDDGLFPEDFGGERDKLVIALLYGTGIRLQELLTLTDSQLDLVRHQIKVTGKRNKQRIVPFSRSLKPQIESYLRHRDERFGGGATLVVTDSGNPAYEKLVYRIVTRYLGQVTRLDKRSPHILRHTYATHLLNKGADLNAVKELLGHASLAATEVYTHITFEKLHTIYQQAHPRG